jgi:hypothetical protein
MDNPTPGCMKNISGTGPLYIRDNGHKDLRVPGNQSLAKAGSWLWDPAERQIPAAIQESMDWNQECHTEQDSVPKQHFGPKVK